jgi:hypothetical protein
MDAQRSKFNLVVELGSRFAMESKITRLDRSPYQISSSKITFEDGCLRLEGADGDGKPVFMASFDGILLFRVADEGARLRLIRSGQYKNDLVAEILQSHLITWLKDESLDSRDISQLKHFLIFLGEEIVDVISFTEPKIERRTG